MNKTVLEPFFSPTVQNKIENIISQGFENFEGFELEIAGVEYEFQKVSPNFIGFFTFLMDNDFKSYFLPIAVFNEKSEAGIYPLYQDFFNENDFPTKLKILSIGGLKTRLCVTISSIGTLNEIYDTIEQLRNGQHSEMSSGNISFKVTDLFNASINFHTLDGKKHIATMDYTYNEIDQEVIFKKIKFLGEYEKVGQAMAAFSFAICNNLLGVE